MKSKLYWCYVGEHLTQCRKMAVWSWVCSANSSISNHPLCKLAFYCCPADAVGVNVGIVYIQLRVTPDRTPLPFHCISPLSPFPLFGGPRKGVKTFPWETIHSISFTLSAKATHWLCRRQMCLFLMNFSCCYPLHGPFSFSFICLPWYYENQ